MCVLPPLIPVSCTRWANIERPIFRRFRPWLVAGWVEDMSKLCLAAVLVAIYGHNNSLLRSQMISGCARLGRAHKSSFQTLIQDLFCANRASIIVVLKVISTEELRIGKILGRGTLAGVELPLAQYLATECVLSSSGREDTCQCRN